MSGWAIFFIIIGIFYAISIILFIYVLNNACHLGPNDSFYKDEVGPKDFKIN